MPPRKSRNSSASLEEPVAVKKAKRASDKTREVAKKIADVESSQRGPAINMNSDLDSDEDYAEADTGVGTREDRKMQAMIASIERADNAFIPVLFPSSDDEDDGDFKVHDRSVQLKIDDKGDFSYNVDVSGYRQKDINVELKGNKIMFRGEYKKQNGDDHFVHHKFGRSVNIPAGINKATFQWEMDNGGHVCISAQSESAAEPRRIPIKIKEDEQPKKQIKVEFEIHH